METVVRNARSWKTATVFVASLVATGLATAAFAGEGDGRGDNAPVPGVVSSAFEPVITDGFVFEATSLTKFIPAAAFRPANGSFITFEGLACVTAADTGGSLTVLDAPVELPDGARISSVHVFGEDSSPIYNMHVNLYRTTVTEVLLGSTTRSEASVTSFDTSAASGEFHIVSPGVGLNEVTGRTFGGGIATHNFHEIAISMDDTTGSDIDLCGVEVHYQVPAIAAGPATVFYPISPIRAFDSRIAAYPGDGILAPNDFRVINIVDGHDGAGNVNAPGVIPAGATAIAYNITVSGPTGPNFLSVTPGDAASYTASTINFTTSALANSAIVALSPDRTIKIWSGNQTGSTFFIIDVTGYYAPMPNMGS